MAGRPKATASAVRRAENAAAWAAAALAWGGTALGLVGPLLGGDGPGLQGRVGFAAETIAAVWIPGGVFTAVVAAAALLRRRWRPAAALAAAAVVILAPESWATSRSRVLGAPDFEGRALRVAAVNLQEENDDDPLMEQCLRQIDADVLVLPEFTRSWAARLERWFAADYPHRLVAEAPGHRGYHIEGFRIAVWSRLPPAGGHEVLDLLGNAQIRVPLSWRGRTFALYGIHPRKPYPWRSYAPAWRDRQRLLDWIRRERLPAVVAGDFNAPPRSAFVRRLRLLGLSNASEAVCGTAPATWPMHPPRFAPLRVAIDHVMHSDALTAVGFRRGMPTRSDHAPVFAELTWQNE